MMRKMLSRMALLGLAAGLALSGMGCRSAPVSFPPFGVSRDYQVLSGQPGPGLVADPQSPIPDVAKPIGFKPVVGLSSASTDGRSRTVHHVYEGVGAGSEAVDFYRRSLPLDGWRFTGQRSLPTDGTVLTYRKGPEDLQVRVTQNYAVTTIIVDITPQGVPPQPAGQAAPRG